MSGKYSTKQTMSKSKYTRNKSGVSANLIDNNKKTLAKQPIDIIGRNMYSVIGADDEHDDNDEQLQEEQKQYKDKDKEGEDGDNGIISLDEIDNMTDIKNIIPPAIIRKPQRLNDTSTYDFGNEIINDGVENYNDLVNPIDLDDLLDPNYMNTQNNDYENTDSDKLDNPGNLENLGTDYKFRNPWVLWVHNTRDEDWTIESYEQVYNMENISDFWKFFNNFNQMSFRDYHFFIMRDGIKPIWEDDNNRLGGVCSFKVDINESINLFLDLAMRIVNESIINVNNDVNGVSFSPRNNWVIIKIWNKDKNNNIADLIGAELRNKYKNYNPKYKQMAPEY